MDEHYRLKKLRRSLKLSQGSLARAIDRKQGSISDIERGRNSVDGILPLLKLAFGVNPEWMKTGKGDMFLTKEEPVGDPELKQSGVPFFSAAFLELSSRQASQRLGGITESPLAEEPAGSEPLTHPSGQLLAHEPPEYYIDFKPFNDCTAYFPYRGDSMYPKFMHGDIIAVKKVLNPDILLWGEAYLVWTDESANSLRTVRHVLKHPDASRITLRALNPEYSGDMVIKKSAIVALYLVKGRISVTL